MAAREAVAPDPGSDAEAVRQRRAALKNDDGSALLGPEAPVIGLALSGGGIRSATFCLGLLRALARNGVLHRFDYLSTVSGGGYIGAMWGRLFHREAKGALEVERGLADDGSLLLWWLRNNGRYLLPSGGRDLLQAFSGQFRSFVATQFEVMVVSLFLACLVVLPHVIYSLLLGPSSVPLLSISLWWWLMPLPGVAALTLSYGYWMLGLAVRLGFGLSVLAAGVAGYLLYLGFLSPVPPSGPLLDMIRAGALVVVPVVFGWLAAVVSNRRREQESNRVAYTKGLAFSFGAAGLLLVLGCLDMGSWVLRDAFLDILHGEERLTLSLGIGWTSLLVVVARAIAPLLSSKERVAATGLPLEAVGNVLGLALITLVAVFWLGVFQMILLPNDDAAFMGWPAAYLYFPVAVLVGMVFLLLTGNELQQLNRSSLHFFYRSRLARTYLSVGNYPEAGRASEGSRFPISPLAQNNRDLTGLTQRVTDLLPGDDTLLDTYCPHASGGPIHLINCCINQTTDDRTGLFNADRKGVSLTVGPLGVETGTQLPTAGSRKSLAGTSLAEWVAISGAAIGSGMGSLTRPGVAIMTFLSGFRLGYWQHALIARRAAPKFGLAKYRSMLQEMFARFPGLNAPYWYISDGGHFDNTGVYALLKRRLPLILLADCGADPDYRFADVENLVRKARIDHDALIEFVDPTSLAPLVGPLAPRFGEPSSIGPGGDEAHLMLARVSYRDGFKGALLVVKPRLVPDLDLDITGYAARNPAFPQQSTLNQFFSEEEWEGYCSLGLALGRPIDAAMIDSAVQWAWQGQVTSALATAPDPATADTRKTPRRIARTVGTSLGAGVLITSLLAGWQAWGDYQKNKQEQESAFASAVRDADAGLQSATQGFTPDLKFRLDALRNYADQHALSDSQQRRVREIAERIRPLCDKTAAPTLKTDCSNMAARWGNEGMDIRSYWSDSLARYTNWPTRGNTREQGQATSASTAVPPPPPPPMEANPASQAPAVVAAEVPASASSASTTRQTAPRPTENPLSAASAETDIQPADIARQCTPGDGRSITLYTQIYDEQQRSFALDLLAKIRPFGIVVPGVENVAATAKRNQRKPPIPWGQPTLLYGPEGKQCAIALSHWMSGLTGPAQALPLPSSMTSGSNTIELWLPGSTTVTNLPLPAR